MKWLFLLPIGFFFSCMKVDDYESPQRPLHFGYLGSTTYKKLFSCLKDENSFDYRVDTSGFTVTFVINEQRPIMLDSVSYRRKFVDTLACQALMKGFGDYRTGQLDEKFTMVTTYFNIKGFDAQERSTEYWFRYEFIDRAYWLALHKYFDR